MQIAGAKNAKNAFLGRGRARAADVRCHPFLAMSEHRASRKRQLSAKAADAALVPTSVVEPAMKKKKTAAATETTSSTVNRAKASTPPKDTSKKVGAKTPGRICAMSFAEACLANSVLRLFRVISMCTAPPRLCDECTHGSMVCDPRSSCLPCVLCAVCS